MGISTISTISPARVIEEQAGNGHMMDVVAEKAVYGQHSDGTRIRSRSPDAAAAAVHTEEAAGMGAQLRHMRKHDVYEPEGNALTPSSTGIYDASSGNRPQNTEEGPLEEASEKPEKADRNASPKTLRKTGADGDKEKDEDPVVGQLGITVGELDCDREEHKQNPRLHNQYECKKRVISASVRPLRKSESGKY